MTVKAVSTDNDTMLAQYFNTVKCAWKRFQSVGIVDVYVANDRRKKKRENK